MLTLHLGLLSGTTEIRIRGSSSEKGVDSLTSKHVSVRNKKSKSCEEKKTFRRKFLFASDQALKRTKQTFLSSLFCVKMHTAGCGTSAWNENKWSCKLNLIMSSKIILLEQNKKTPRLTIHQRIQNEDTNKNPANHYHL